MSLRDHLSVLVVDDMSTTRGILGQMFDTLGIVHVDFAKNGSTALARAQFDPPMLVLSDLHMPGMDGLALLAALRQEPLTRETPFILMTDRADPAVMAAGGALAMDGVLPKPFDIEMLRSGLEAVMGRL
ncbi:MAG: response regulator [Pseudomonadota bacterium]